MWDFIILFFVKTLDIDLDHLSKVNLMEQKQQKNVYKYTLSRCEVLFRLDRYYLFFLLFLSVKEGK